MIVVQEVTEWSTPYQPNHILFLSNGKDKLFAYISSITGEKKIFSKPMDFDPRYRKFELIRKVEDEQEGIAVKGSKGDVYYVTEKDGEYRCTCVGFKYHSTCKHIETVKNGNNN